MSERVKAANIIRKKNEISHKAIRASLEYLILQSKREEGEVFRRKAGEATLETGMKWRRGGGGRRWRGGGNRRKGGGRGGRC